MLTLSKPSKARKVPFGTVIDFTVNNFKNAMLLVQSHGLDQVQFCSRTDRGFHAQVYADRVTFYANYSLPRRLGSHARRTGKVQVGVLGLHTIAQAREKYLEVRRNAYAGIDPKATRSAVMTYSQFHDEHYLLQCLSRGKKTLKTDLQRYETWIKPDFGGLSLSDITVTHGNKLIVKMQEAGRAAATIRNVMGLLTSSLNLAVEAGLLEKNPLKAVRLPKAYNRRTATFTLQEMSAFMVAASKRQEIVASRLLMLLALTGARLGEATAAEWGDIDLDRGVWKIKTQKSGKPGVIYLSGAARSVLQDVQPFQRDGKVFPGSKGNRVLSRPIRLFRRILDDAGIDAPYRIHDLRHAWCTQLIEAGVPIEIVSQGARHATPGTTRIYIQPHAEALTAANEVLAGLLLNKVVELPLAA